MVLEKIVLHPLGRSKGISSVIHELVTLVLGGGFKSGRDGGGLAVKGKSSSHKPSFTHIQLSSSRYQARVWN
jgi:hypothetical protein